MSYGVICKWRLNRAYLSALLVLLPVGVLPARAGDCREWLVDLGYGQTRFAGSDGKVMSKGQHFRGGAGFALTHPPDTVFPAPHCHLLFLSGNFFFERAGIEQTAVNTAIAANQTNPALLAATAGKARFYSVTADPTLRFAAGGPVTFYGFGSVGWLLRRIEFTGPGVQGALLQPVNPASFTHGGNSAVFGGGGGVDFSLGRRTGRMKLFGEVRVLRGIGVNSNTTLAPVSLGIRW